LSTYSNGTRVALVGHATTKRDKNVCNSSMENAVSNNVENCSVLFHTFTLTNKMMDHKYYIEVITIINK